MTKSTQIILPNRIGDSILSLPALLCLKQLQEKYDKDREVTIHPPFHLFEIIWSYKLFDTKLLEEILKVHSWFDPADETYFLNTSYKAWGLRTKKSFGENIPAKKFLKFDVDMPCLSITKTNEHMPESLIKYLSETFGFSTAIIRIFGMLLEMGYSEKQVVDTFRFSNDSLQLEVEELNTWSPTIAKNGYLVCCMEAAYGRKREAKRRWQEDNFIELAEKLYKETGLMTVFIGTDIEFKIDKSKHYLIDMRRKHTLLQLAQLLKYSKVYFGNDTGPLHLANLMKTPSVCIYLSTTPEVYGPIFTNLNTPIIQPESSDSVFQAIVDLAKIKA